MIIKYHGVPRHQHQISYVLNADLNWTFQKELEPLGVELLSRRTSAVSNQVVGGHLPDSSIRFTGFSPEELSIVALLSARWHYPSSSSMVSGAGRCQPSKLASIVI